MLFEKLSRVLLRSIPFFPAGPEIIDLFHELTQSQKDIDKQVEEAVASLRTSAALVTQLEQSVNERMATLTELKSEYDRISKLTEISQEQAEVLMEQLEITLGKNKGRGIVISIFVSVFAGLVVFVFGIFTAGYIKQFFSAIFEGG